MRYNKLKTRISVIIAMCFFLTCSHALAKKPLDEADIITPKSISGTVSMISQDSLSVVYKEDRINKTEWEMLIPLDMENLTLSGVRNFSSIKVGDTISVDYNEFAEEYSKVNEQGQLRKGKKVIGHKGTRIKMIKTSTQGSTGKGALRSN